jgi:RNA polymerase sigma-32 factor
MHKLTRMETEGNKGLLDLLEPIEPANDRAEGPAHVGRDALDRYVQEIRNHAPLDRAEEHELAVRYRATGDRDAAERLVTANLRLVLKLAHEYQRTAHNLADLVQEGNIGLVLALDKYDPDRGVRLSTYASWWIRAYMLRFILNNWRLVRIGTTPAQRKLFFNLRKQQEQLERQGITPTASAVAQALDVPVEEVTAMQERMGRGELSLDAPLGTGESDERTPLDLIADRDPRPDQAVEAVELRQRLHLSLEAFGRSLRGREETIFRDRLISDAPRTLQEIGAQYAISRERARQLERDLVVRLRGHLRRDLGDAVETALAA